MKSCSLFAAILLSISVVNAQYVPVDQGSDMLFKIKNFGFDVIGRFTGLKGSIRYDPANLNQCRFDVIIDASSVNTDNRLRDDHLKQENYFDVKNYPTIHLLSEKISQNSNNGELLLTGQLTLKGITREIRIPFTATAFGDTYVFKGSFKLKRKDFKIGGTSTISDELEVDLNVRTIKS